MKYCSNCGKKIDAIVKFCSNCGAKQNQSENEKEPLAEKIENKRLYVVCSG